MIGSDGVAAMEDVYKNGYLHRDFSDTSIILFRFEVGGDRRGFVIDWNNASKIGQNDEEEVRNHRRTVGTRSKSYLCVELTYSFCWNRARKLSCPDTR